MNRHGTRGDRSRRPARQRMACIALPLALAVATGDAHGDGGQPGTTAVVFHSVEPLAWMAGAWSFTTGTQTSEEHWLAPAGGAMLGMNRDVRDGKMADFEFMRIEASAEGVFYIASPRGAPPVQFRLVESGVERVVFANPDHDFPKRILYWIGDDERLHARIEGETPDKGEEWAWTRLAAKP